MDFGKYINEFSKEMIYKRYSKNSINCYVSCLNNYFDYFNKRPKDISQSEIKDYLYELTILDKSPQLIIQVISALKKFYKLNGQPNKLKGIDNPRVFDNLVEPLSIEQMRLLINSIKNIKHKAIISLIYSGALRISELLNLKWSDLKRDRRLIFIKDGKGSRDRYVPLYKETINILEKYWNSGYKTNGRIFHGQNKDVYSASSIRQFLSREALKIGLNNVYPHLIRHSALTNLHENGVSLRTIQKIAGHAKSTTTERYTRVSNLEIGNIINPISEIA